MTLLTRNLAILSAAGLLAFFAVGCRKKTEANAPSQATNQPAAQVQAEGQPVAEAGQPPPAAAAVVTDPADLNRELRKWILRNQRPPKNFEDFASTAGIQFPTPPDGKKYAIDKTMHVVLVKR